MDTAKIASKGFIQRLFIAKSSLKDKYLKSLEAVIESTLFFSTIKKEPKAKCRTLFYSLCNVQMKAKGFNEGLNVVSYMDTVKVEK